jgi:LemA protein
MTLLIAAAVCGAIFLRVRGDLSQQRDGINSNWAQVNEAMEQRAALSRRMAERFQAIGDPAPAVAPEIASARTALSEGAGAEQKIRANDRLSAALSKLLLESERRPRVNADTEFHQMEEELRSVEDRIAVARLNYNDALAHYNARIQSFPHNVVAHLAGYRRDDAYFKTIPF